MGQNHESKHEHHEHHQELDYETQSAIKHQMSLKLRNFYDHHQLPLLFRPFSWLKHKFQSEEKPIDLTQFQEVPIENLSESQQLKRTIFAMQKLKTFNHHFFDQTELRVLEPLPLGAITYTMWVSFAAFNGIYMAYLWKNWSFNRKSVGFLLANCGVQYALSHIPNFLCESVIQQYRRNQLAQKYIKIYGAEFFHQIASPRFDLHKLEHLHNQIQTYH